MRDTSFTFAPLSFSYLVRSTPVDRRIKEDAAVDSPGFKAPFTSIHAKRLPSAGEGEGTSEVEGKEGGKWRRERERRNEREFTPRVFGEDTLFTRQT